ncbi:hypothetical protein ANCCAN_24796 [Ancylostoma caninum]|uniref:Uncharacterized protein n=1 Tax=Ancylostoma caninum TaxID=29170 RepID=A0A368FBF1_ANCCA|nr:hypothetical protein ANCCAN_24796 [Ancylostoma caninum]
MKECISEQDHYHTFPNKGYPIDEECDLVEVQGEEVAYCLCRNQNLCNKPTIADQSILNCSETPSRPMHPQQSRPGQFHWRCRCQVRRKSASVLHWSHLHP